VALCTSLGVIVFGVLPGILVGITLSLLKVLGQIVHPQDALLGKPPGSEEMHDVGDDESARTIPGLVVYRFYGPLLFANVRFFIERLEYFMARETQPVRHVILDARAIPDIDVTAAEQLQTYFHQLRQRGITLAFAKAQLPLREAARQMGMDETIAEGKYFQKLSDAVSAFERSVKPPGESGSPGR
jgi:SulP family sulfate permease